MLRNKQRGLTILELLLAAFLFFLVTISFFTIRERKAAMKPIYACTAKKWGWLQIADELEWKLRQWEMQASPCLRAGFQPVISDSITGLPGIYEVVAVSPIVRKTVSPVQYPVPADHQFMAGQEIVVCSGNSFHRGKIEKGEVGDSKQSLLGVAPLGNASMPLPPPGAFVVAIAPVVYETASNPSLELPFGKVPRETKEPLGIDLDEWSITAATDEPTQSVRVTIQMQEGECQFSRTMTLSGEVTLSKPGRWWIREGELFFEFWMINKGDLPS